MVAGGFLASEVVHLSPENSYVALDFLHRTPTQYLFHNISSLLF